MANNDRTFDKRDRLSDKYDYEVFDFALCVRCIYFSFSNTKNNVDWAGKNGCGNCALLKHENAYNGVMTTAVCNKFLSSKGTNINGHKVRNYYGCTKTRKNKKTGEVFTVE